MKIIKLMFIVLLLLPSVMAEIAPQQLEFLLNAQNDNFLKHLDNRDNATYEQIELKYDEFYLKIRKDTNKIIFKVVSVFIGALVCAYSVLLGLTYLYFRKVNK